MSAPQPPPSFETAWERLGRLYPAESWFRDVHLAENRGRIRRMLGDITSRVPAGPDVEVVDVGCFNGFLCQLLHQLGYATTGIDAIADSAVPERADLMASIDAPFHFGNFNERDPFPTCPRGRFAAAIVGEVFEHILFHPLGFVEQVRDLLRPGGLMILTTPNPYTLANVMRLLRGRWITWGDTEFATMPKLDGTGRMISYEGIHYREYGQQTLVEVVEKAGFEVIERAYLASDPHPRQPWLRRTIKGMPMWRWLASHRLFGHGHYLVASRRDG